jgi:hypothetical protein
VTPSFLLAQAGDLGEGSIDNLVLRPAVHRLVGILVLVSLAAAGIWLGRLVAKGLPYDTAARWLTGVAQGVLMVQALLGIKLLDQGQGFNQLYIHYLGGLAPLGIYIVLCWIPISDPKTRARVVLAGTLAGLFAAAMAFVIGQAFVNR